MLSKDSVLKICLEVLTSNGWNFRSGVAIAQKEFQSAVGVKEAFVFLSNGDEYFFVLSGDYQSRGNNALASHSTLIPKKSTLDQVEVLVKDFTKDVERVIQDTYAMRLFALGIRPHVTLDWCLN